jgi:hypothetical protein
MSRSYASSPPWRLHSSSGTALLFPPECGVGLVPKSECLLPLAYYAFPRWHEFGEWKWNDILTRENWRSRRKTCPPSATLSTTNITWIDSGANPGLRVGRPVTNNLSLGKATALLYFYNHAKFYVTKQLYLKWHGKSTSIQGVSMGPIESKYIVKVQFQSLISI